MIYPSKFHKPHRLKQFDYSSACSYMLTFNTKNRERILSKIILETPFEPPYVKLLPFGIITEKNILNIPSAYSDVELDNYVIMPDHVHVLMTIMQRETNGQGLRTKVSKVIQATKSLITHEIGFSIWQLDYYDVIADTEETFLRCNKYIDDNPAAWLDGNKEPAKPK